MGQEQLDVQDEGKNQIPQMCNTRLKWRNVKLHSLCLFFTCTNLEENKNLHATIKTLREVIELYLLKSASLHGEVAQLKKKLSHVFSC